jgi:hypothetical protein
VLTNWDTFVNTALPTLSIDPNIINSSSSSYNCYFNLTASENKSSIAMGQNIGLAVYSLFLDSGEANYSLSVDAACVGTFLDVIIVFRTVDSVQISESCE